MSISSHSYLQLLIVSENSRLPRSGGMTRVKQREWLISNITITLQIGVKTCRYMVNKKRKDNSTVIQHLLFRYMVSKGTKCSPWKELTNDIWCIPCLTRVRNISRIGTGQMYTMRFFNWFIWHRCYPRFLHLFIQSYQRYSISQIKW